jgi:phosphoesterase RecJ-like protein
VYDKTQVDQTGEVAWSAISYDELIATGCSPSDIDEQVLIPRSIEGVRVAVLFSQPTPEYVRLNIRCEDGISILPLAQSFGGGGHAQAAGAVIFGPIGEVVSTVLRRVKEYLAGVNAARAIQAKSACRR